MQFHSRTWQSWLFSVHQLTVEVIFCYACWPEEDLWICEAGRGFMCHLEKNLCHSELQWARTSNVAGVCLQGNEEGQVYNSRRTVIQTKTQKAVTKRREWLSLRTHCCALQSRGNKNTELLSLVQRQSYFNCSLLSAQSKLQQHNSSPTADRQAHFIPPPPNSEPTAGCCLKHN